MSLTIMLYIQHKIQLDEYLIDYKNWYSKHDMMICLAAAAGMDERIKYTVNTNIIIGLLVIKIFENVLATLYTLYTLCI